MYTLSLEIWPRFTSSEDCDNCQKFWFELEWFRRLMKCEMCEISFGISVADAISCSRFLTLTTIHNS